MERLICFAGLIIGYFFGCMVAAFFVGTAKKVDIRKKGSGNLGTTNAFRTVGIGGGIATGVGDMLKVVIVVLLVYFVVVKGLKVDIDRIPLYLYTGFGAILGHDFPFYLHFKGGKGVAPLPCRAPYYVGRLEDDRDRHHHFLWDLHPDPICLFSISVYDDSRMHSIYRFSADWFDKSEPRMVP